MPIFLKKEKIKKMIVTMKMILLLFKVALIQANQGTMAIFIKAMEECQKI